ncbi:MAG TPA: sterol desaturase family protein [Candidatus Binatia bacterium]|jgi:sterol desaturase/sphingolipid hydroxylase (fatty acid hydroxylase superfamily)|nr:sterol desaturase family protein [Candidatus Binatia bacterium]
MSILVTHEGWVRFGAFAIVLAVCAAAERTWPVRGDARPAGRQAVNLALVAANTAILRIGFPFLAVELALRGGGLLGTVAWPPVVEVVLAVTALDLAIYWQHRLMHRIPLLWPLHRVHHTDLAIDVTTGVRFHPLEIALSMGIKLGVVALLGPPAAAVVLFEVLLSAGSLFTHTDTALPAAVERMARAAIITPSLHRIHHSVRRDETDSNFGFTTSLWDRLFRSLRATPRDPERTMPIGLPGWRDPSSLGLGALLVQPFRSCDNGSVDA